MIPKLRQNRFKNLPKNKVQKQSEKTLKNIHMKCTNDIENPFKKNIIKYDTNNSINAIASVNKTAEKNILKIETGALTIKFILFVLKIEKVS